MTQQDTQLGYSRSNEYLLPLSHKRKTAYDNNKEILQETQGVDCWAALKVSLE